MNGTIQLSRELTYSRALKLQKYNLQLSNNGREIICDLEIKEICEIIEQFKKWKIKAIGIIQGDSDKIIILNNTIKIFKDNQILNPSKYRE